MGRSGKQKGRESRTPSSLATDTWPLSIVKDRTRDSLPALLPLLEPRFPHAQRPPPYRDKACYSLTPFCRRPNLRTPSTLLTPETLWAVLSSSLALQRPFDGLPRPASTPPSRPVDGLPNLPHSQAPNTIFSPIIQSLTSVSPQLRLPIPSRSSPATPPRSPQPYLPLPARPRAPGLLPPLPWANTIGSLNSTS